MFSRTITRTCVAQVVCLSCAHHVSSSWVCSDSLRLLHFPLSADHLLSCYPVLLPAHQLHLPRCGGQIPRAHSLMRTLAPLPSTTLSHFRHVFSDFLFHRLFSLHLFYHEASFSNHHSSAGDCLLLELVDVSRRRKPDYCVCTWHSYSLWCPCFALPHCKHPSLLAKCNFLLSLLCPDSANHPRKGPCVKTSATSLQLLSLSALLL